MSTYLSDDEQAEALKKWWKENAVSIIVGAGLGFGIIFGWQGWQMMMPKPRRSEEHTSELQSR